MAGVEVIDGGWTIRFGGHEVAVAPREVEDTGIVGAVPVPVDGVEELLVIGGPVVEGGGMTGALNTILSGSSTCGRNTSLKFFITRFLL